MKSFLTTWHYKQARRSFRRHNARECVSHLKHLIELSPRLAATLLCEALLKIMLIFPRHLYSSISFWLKRTLHITPQFYKNVVSCGLNSKARNEKVIVTLTSYPKRIGTIHKVVNTLLNQTYKPDMVILWLAPEQFPGRERDLPKKLLALRQYGLTIDWYRDIKSFKKLIPALKKYPDALLVTADDDIYYPPDWLEKLVVAHKKYPKCVVCHGAHRIRFDVDGSLLPYRQWKFGVGNCIPSRDVFVTCGAGALYAPGVLHADVTNEALFQEMCPYADDIWYWSMAILNGTKIKVVDQRVKKICSVYEADNSAALSRENMMEGNRNDLQLANVLMRYPKILELLRS